MPSKAKAPIGGKHSNAIPALVKVNAAGDQYVDIPVPTNRKSRIVGYYSLMPGAMRELEASVMQAQLIHLILEHQDSRHTGLATMTQAEMAENLDTTEAYIQLCVSQMIKRRMLFKGGRGRYRVNSHIGFQGTKPAWEQQQTSDARPVWRRQRPTLELVGDPE